MIKGTTTVEIDALDEEGAGVGDCEGRRVHVPFALPGERVEAEVQHLSPHSRQGWARLFSVERASPDRVKAACAAWGRCGGCLLQHLAYPRQLEHKRRLVEEALAGAGVRAEVAACEGHEQPLGYRNRAKLVFARAGEQVVLGAYAPRSHRVVDLAGCRVVEPALDAIAVTAARLATELGVRPYDEREATGDARYAILRSDGAGRVQAMFVVARRGARGVAELARALRRERPEVAGVVENLQPSRGNALVGVGEPDLVLDGEPVLCAALAWEPVPVRLRLSPRSFFQASWPMAARLYRAVVAEAALRPGEVGLDLYSGVGGIALAMAGAATGAEVIGVEEAADAVEDARAGAALNNLSNVRFICGDAARFLGERASSAERTDVVTVDPPRKGLSPPVTSALLRLRPRAVVYVSCAPGTLARDLALLVAGGYGIARVTPFDLMPHTPHVETVAVLHRRA